MNSHVKFEQRSSRREWIAVDLELFVLLVIDRSHVHANALDERLAHVRDFRVVYRVQRADVGKLHFPGKRKKMYTIKIIVGSAARRKTPGAYLTNSLLWWSMAFCRSSLRSWIIFNASFISPSSVKSTGLLLSNMCTCLNGKFKQTVNTRWKYICMSVYSFEYKCVVYPKHTLIRTGSSVDRYLYHLRRRTLTR